jgi:hypothetical protein
VGIPFELKSGYVIFTVLLGSFGPLDFLLDTGCQTTVIHEETLGTRDKGQALVMLLGTHEFKIDNYHIRPLSALPKAIGQEIDGVIGNDLFHGFTVKLDFEQKLLFIYDSEDFIANPRGEEIELNVNTLVSSLVLSLSFPDGKELEGEFVIDTGAPISVLLNSPIAEQHGINVDPEKNREFKTQADVQTAVEITSDIIRIGAIECVNVPIFISTSNKGLFAVKRYAGLVGTGLLQNFNVIFDYTRNRVNLEKIDKHTPLM